MKNKLICLTDGFICRPDDVIKVAMCGSGDGCDVVVAFESGGQFTFSHKTAAEAKLRFKSIKDSLLNGKRSKTKKTVR